MTTNTCFSFQIMQIQGLKIKLKTSRNELISISPITRLYNWVKWWEIFDPHPFWPKGKKTSSMCFFYNTSSEHPGKSMSPFEGRTGNTGRGHIPNHGLRSPLMTPVPAGQLLRALSLLSPPDPVPVGGPAEPTILPAPSMPPLGVARVLSLASPSPLGRRGSCEPPCQRANQSWRSSSGLPPPGLSPSHPESLLTDRIPTQASSPLPAIKLFICYLLRSLCPGRRQ